MPIFRTTTCGDSGHPEFTLVFIEEPPTPNAVGWILDHFEAAVAAGTRFVPGQNVAIGWRTLRVIERDDRTLGVEERVGEAVWEEHVDQALGDLWYQVEAAAKLGLPEEPDSVAEDQMAAIEGCAFDAAKLIFNRVGPDSPHHSGWFVSCGDEHGHSEWSYLELFKLSAAFPFATQFLALPPETGLVIERHQVSPAGGALAHAAYDGAMLTPDDGVHFGPEPEVRHPIPQAHFAIGMIGEGLYRTTVGDRYGHPDIVARLTEPVIPGTDDSLVQWVLDDLADSIAAGRRFVPGQTIRVGSRTLRVAERDDGMLGLQERVGADSWEEHVEQALRDTWYQNEVAASLGLAKRLAFPTEDQNAVVAECVNEATPALLLTREETRPSTSGWMVSCLHDHDHGAWSLRTIWDLTDEMPFATQFLALPASTSVAIEAPHATPTGRIRVRVLLGGRRLIPQPGSYLATVNDGS